MDMNTFYAVFAGATATLLGLLFVAVQFNIRLVIDDPHDRWYGLTIATFSIYTQLLVMSMLSFLPLVRGPGLLIAAVLGSYRQIRAWLPTWRNTLIGHHERLWETFWLLVGPIATFIVIAISANGLVNGKGTDAVEQNIAVCFIGLMVIVLRNTWRLLLDIARDRQLQANMAKVTASK